MAKYLPLPNGYSLKVPDEMGYDEAIALARQRFPDAFGEAAPKKGGIAGALGLGLESLLSSYKTAAGAVTDPEQAAKAALERQKALGEKYAEPTSLERVKKAYEEQGLLSAAKEVASQVPSALAEQAPQLATMFGGARLGAMAGSPLGPAGTVAGGVLGAGAALLPQFFGANIERQAAEQEKAGQPIEIDRGTALGAAAAQAAAEAAGTALTLGGRLVSKLTKIPEEALLLGKGNAQKLAEERLRNVVLKGTAKGFAAELPVELVQQMAERAQAGLSLTDKDALEEYGQTAYQVGLLSPLGAAGRLSERAGAREEVAKTKAEEARKAAEAAEAAKNTPEALNQLYEQYQGLRQQKQALDEQIKALQPKKGASAEEKQAFVDARAKREEFLKTQYRPVEQEYNKRKGAIDDMFAQRQSALEVEAASTQPAAKQIVASDLPDAEAYQLAPVSRLMGTYGDLSRQLADIQTQLGEAPDPETHTQLETQRQLLTAKMNELAPVIEQKGGTTDTQEELDKKLKAAEKERIKFLEQGDFDAAAKQIEKLKALQLQIPMLEEARLMREQAGQTRELFGGATPVKTEADIQREQETLAAEKEQKDFMAGKPTPVEPKAAEIIQPAQLQAVETAKAKVDQAEQQVTQLAQAKGTKTPDLYRALDALNQAEAERSRAQEDVGRPALKPAVLDIFDPYNIMQEALRRGDTKLLNDLARQSQRQTLQQSLDEKADERTRLINVLEGRLDAEGIKRERADLFSDIYDKEQQARFKNGTYPDTELQKLYDQGGPAAVEYEWVLNQTKPLMAKVTTPQGNAKKSLYQQLVEAAAEHADAVAALESGIATPTMREKTAALQAKHGKGEAPGPRQMDAGERAQLQKRIDGLVTKYRMIEGKITPIRDQILALHNSLYKTTKLEKPSERGASPRQERKETATLRAQAVKLGEETKAYQTWLANNEEEVKKRQEALDERARQEQQATGDVSKATTDEIASFEKYKAQLPTLREEKAAELGRQTNAHQAALGKVTDKRKAAGEDFSGAAVSRMARTASRLARGDVRREAETSEKLRNLARQLGEQDPEFEKFSKNLTRRLDALVKRYGAEDKAVAAFRSSMGQERLDKAMELGKKTPEYKRTLKEQVEYFKEVLPTAGKQEVPTKRTGQVTRKQSGAPKRLVSSSEESKATSRREQEAFIKMRGSLKDLEEGAAADREGREDERFARGVEAESPDLSSAQIQALENNDLTAALEDLAKDEKNANAFNRVVAKRLAALLGETDVKVTDKLTYDGKEVLGAATSKLVELNRNGGLSQEILLHEGTHAATERVIVQYEKDPSKLTEQQRAAMRELKAIFEIVKNDPRITSINAKSSLSEFVAEVMSNKKLQEQLKEKPWRMSDMLRAFKSIVLRMLGISPAEVQTMFGASVTAIDALFIPSSERLGGSEQRVTRQLSAKDIAALHDGSNSMQQFADQFGPLIKQADRTPEDVERIADKYITDMKRRPEEYVPFVDGAKLDYTAQTTMSDGKQFDPENPLHYVEATAVTFDAKEAQADPDLAEREAREINKQRLNDFKSLIQYVKGNRSYTLAEQALVLKAASQYAVVSDKSGRLKLAALADNNRHGIAVVSHEAADAVIRELRAGKSLKKAFLEGLQANADKNAEVNQRKNGWQKFEQATEKNVDSRYTPDEINDAIDRYEDRYGSIDNAVDDRDEIISLLVEKKFLPKRSSTEDAAVALNAGAAGTPWCTGASVSTARSQIEGGDFYIYYKNGRPEVAVRMNGTDAIGEVRGNSPNQALTPEQQQIAADFLRNSSFRDSEKYLSEFNLREKLVAIAKGEDEFTAQDLLNLSSEPVDDDGNVNKRAVARMLSFRTIDGYGGRPAPSDKVIAFFGEELKDAVFEQYANNAFIFSDIYVNGTGRLNYKGEEYPQDKTITVEFGGQTFEATVDTLVAADSITFAGYRGRNFVLPKLAYVKDVSLHGSEDAPINVTLPAAKFIKTLKTFAEQKDTAIVTLPANARVETLAGYYGSDTYVEVRGPLHIDSVRTTMGGDTFLHASLPDTQFFKIATDKSLGLAGNKKTIDAPNFIAETPPVDTLVEEPETPRFAPKDVGVTEEKPGVFGFRRQRAKSDSVVAQEATLADKFLGNVFGLAGRVQLVDQYAALEKAIKAGLSEGQIDSLEATNANYLLRFGQMRSQFAGQFLTNGPLRLELTKQGGVTTSLFRSTKGTTMLDVASALNAAKLATPSEQENMFTVYLAGERAKQVGWDKLNFSNPAKAKAEYDSVVARLAADKQADDAFKTAAKLYQKYNAGLLDFLVQTGVMTPQKAAELKSITYVPYYRVNKNGEVQLMIDKETPVRISNIKDEPQLQQLVGGNETIMPLFTSAVQNTFMITNMGLRNQTVKETSFLLHKLGIASRVAAGAGPAGADVVRFKKNGADYHAVIDTDLYGIPADLIVKGMEGIKTTIPAVVRLMGMPADIMRKFVTRMPAYAVRQVIRDPLNAWLTTGTDATPVLSSMKELASMVAGRSEAERKLMETGAISSNVFSGDEQDMAKYLKDLAAGKSLWAKTMSKADALALKGDAATRAVIYKDSLDKGMSEQEALLRTLESMNFGRRGVSPSMQMLSVLIPFFNAQVQGLDVIYRAFKGDMPYSEQLKIKEKMLARGLMLTAGTLAYAALMSDDEAYKRAKPEERFANWFVYVPGVDEPVRVPIPFELGFLFKALPEAVYGMAVNDEKAGKTLKGLGKLADQSNPFALPQAVKPLTEVVLGRSFFQGDIESAREKEQLATERYRANSTEVAKLLGQVTGTVGISPIKLDYLIRGYFGGLGVAVAQLANPILAADQKEIAQPSTKPSKLPFIGGLFQPVEGRGTLDEAYDRMQEIRQVKGTYNRLVEDGKLAEAKAFAQNYANDLAQTSVSGRVQKQLGELAKQERIIKAHPTMSTEEKDKRLEQIDKVKVQLARQFLALPR
jgi:hypothetical protein